MDKGDKEVSEFSRATRLGSMLSTVYHKLQSRYEARANLGKLDTGFDSLDEIINGISYGNLVVIGGRPQVGKTAIAINLCRNMSRADQGNSVAFFTLENTSEDLVMRMLASEGRVDLRKFPTGAFVVDDWRKLAHATSQLSSNSIIIDDRSFSVEDIRESCKQILKKTEDLGVIVIDYLQLVQINGDADKLIYDLKQMAEDFNIIVVVLSQLKRCVDIREDKRPIVSDFHEFNAIEEMADLILFVYRNSLYNEDMDQKSAEVIVAKNSNGDTGSAYLNFSNGSGSFESLEQGVQC